MSERSDEAQARLQKDAEGVRDQLGIDASLRRIGSPVLVGSAALGVMVARDIDLTVSVPTLDAAVLHSVSALAHELISRPDTRQVVVRDDTGVWNTDPGYPDGVYLGVTCVDRNRAPWSLDIWFVDQPERQPDLNHLATLRPRITPEMQASILTIKRATNGRNQDGSRLPSYEIYEAVLERGIRTPAEFARR